MAKTAWIFSYKLRKNVTKEEFIECTQKLHDEVISKAKGFLSWEHYLQDQTWTDFVLWETEEDARNATIIGQSHAVTQEFYDCIRMQTCRALISNVGQKILESVLKPGAAPDGGGFFCQAGRPDPEIPMEKDFPERRFGRFQRGLTTVFP